MPKIYSIDVPVWATAYIRADSEEKAREIARGLAGVTVEVPWPCTTGRPFDNRRYEELLLDGTYIWSLSPAMTVASDAGQPHYPIELIQEV